MTESLSPPASLQPTLLIVDDHALLRDRLARSFRERGYEVRTAATAEEAVALAQEDPPEFAIVDLNLGDAMGGLAVLKRLKEIDATTRAVILTGYGSVATAVDAMRLGADNYIQKPADADSVIAAFRRAETPVLETDARYDAPSLARIEWDHIHRVLSDCSGNISEAARRLGLHRRSLQRKLQKYAP